MINKLVCMGIILNGLETLADVLHIVTIICLLLYAEPWHLKW